MKLITNMKSGKIPGCSLWNHDLEVTKTLIAIVYYQMGNLKGSSDFDSKFRDHFRANFKLGTVPIFATTLSIPESSW